MRPVSKYSVTSDLAERSGPVKEGVDQCLVPPVVTNQCLNGECFVGMFLSDQCLEEKCLLMKRGSEKRPSRKFLPVVVSSGKVPLA